MLQAGAADRCLLQVVMNLLREQVGVVRNLKGAGRSGINKTLPCRALVVEQKTVTMAEVRCHWRKAGQCYPLEITLIMHVCRGKAVPCASQKGMLPS